RATWIAADVEAYAPDETFDAIVFNEILYYLNDPAGTVDRYVRALRPSGVMVVSMSTAARESGAILDQLRRRYPVRDDVRVTRGENRWSWAILALGGASSGP